MTQAEIEAQLAEMDAAFEPQKQALESAIMDAAAAEPTAGEELAADEAAAEAAAAQASTDYEAYLASLQASINAGASALAEAQSPQGATETIEQIAEANPVSDPGAATADTIQTGDTPDCSAAQVQAALDASIGSVNSILSTLLTNINVAVSEINAAVSLIKQSLEAHDADLLNGAIGALKTAGEAMTESLQLQRTNAPPDVDTDALVDAEIAAIEALV